MKFSLINEDYFGGWEKVFAKIKTEERRNDMMDKRGNWYQTVGINNEKTKGWGLKKWKKNLR